MVNISSVGGFHYAGNGAALYSITKSGIVRMTECLAVESGFTYLIPEQSRGAGGNLNEGWNVGINLAWYPGSLKCGSCRRYQRPMFESLGTPDELKRLAVLEGGHLPPIDQVIRETLSWLDEYLGPVD